MPLYPHARTVLHLLLSFVSLALVYATTRPQGNLQFKAQRDQEVRFNILALATTSLSALFIVRTGDIFGPKEGIDRDLSKWMRWLEVSVALVGSFCWGELSSSFPSPFRGEVSPLRISSNALANETFFSDVLHIGLSRSLSSSLPSAPA